MNADELLMTMRDYGADVDAAMERFVDDAELYRLCLDSFYSDVNFDALREALNAAQVETAFDAAHSLKGVAANLGLTPILTAISALVETLRANSTEGLTEQYDEILRQREILANLLK